MTVTQLRTHVCGAAWAWAQPLLPATCTAVRTAAALGLGLLLTPDMTASVPAYSLGAVGAAGAAAGSGGV
jgi:hypothetical protein